MKLRFDRKAFFIAPAIFVVEVLIALFVRDKFVRPYLGDVLVMGLMYYTVKAFFEIRPLWLALGTFVFACLIEVAQYFQFVEVLGLQDNAVARVVLGTWFTWNDILCYAIGAGICYLIDRK